MKDQYSFTKRNKNQNNKENPFNAYKANKPNLKDKVSELKINKKTLASSSTTYHLKNKSSTLSNIKPMFPYKETLNRAYSKLNSVLHSYNLSIAEINKKITNDIIFDEKKRIVSIFKDFLLWYETSDFFKQYYKKNKSVRLMLRFISYYEVYTKFYPEYGPLEDVLKILKKNMKKKKKYLERIGEDETKKYSNDKNKKFERLIKESELKINTNSKISILQKNHSKSTLMLDSIDNFNEINNNNTNNKDFYSILKKFSDYEDITFDKKEVHTYNNFNDNNDNDYDNIFIFNSKLSKYVKKNFKGDKNIKNKKERNIIIDTKIRNKKFFSISPNLDILNNITEQKIRAKTKEEGIKRLIRKGKTFKYASLKKKINPLLRTINHKINESNSLSKFNKNNTNRYKMKTHSIREKPHNIKKLFNSYNKYENSYNKYDNISIGNYYTLFSYGNKTERNRKRKSPNSLLNSSPPFNLRKKLSNLIISSVRNKKRNNRILNIENLKRLNNINSLKYPNAINSNSELHAKKDSKYNLNINKICIKLKCNKYSTNSSKANKLIQKNTIRKISPYQSNKDYSSKKKKKERIKANNIKNPFNIDNNSIINNSINHNTINLNKLYSNQLGIYSITDFNSYYKIDSKNGSKKNDKIKKNKNNLILLKTNMNPFMKNYISNSSKKKSKLFNMKNSLSIKKSKNNSININTNSKIVSKKENINNKNNIIQKPIDKSMSKNELHIKLKINNNSILKSCFSNINNNNNSKRNTRISDDYDKMDISKKDSIKKFSVLNLDESSSLKNKIIKKQEINNNKSGLKKARICLRLPISNIK